MEQQAEAVAANTAASVLCVVKRAECFFYYLLKVFLGTVITVLVLQVKYTF